jgi:hypothetical protein
MTTRIGRRAWLAAGCTLAFTVAVATSGTTEPAEVSGLVAWYKVDSLHRHKRDGDTIDRWTDTSRRGHDLDAAWENEPPEFDTLQLNELPVVVISGASHFDVARPFELGDHTIFLVCATEYTKRALFRSDSDPKQGVILHQDGQSHYYQKGKEGLFPYNRATDLDADHSITVLGREAGALKAYVNGIDISSGAELTTPIRVGRFFELEHTTFVSSDGESLRIAEMIFYDRYLTDAEREGITGHLSEKYGIAVASEIVERRVVASEGEVAIDEAAVLVRLRTGTDVNVNEELVALGWDAPDKVTAPFRFDPQDANTELHCTRDGTRVRVTLVLPLQSAVADVQVRALILKSGSDWHQEEGESSPLEGYAPDLRAALRFQTVLTLDAGEFIEIVTTRAGEPGPVRLASDGALLVVERIE